MKHSFHVFRLGMKTFERDKRLFLMFSYHDETLELVFHILPETFCFHSVLFLSLIIRKCLSKSLGGKSFYS